ncbi:hypothetical protein GCM10008932_22140 [Alkalibacterium iburiense]|uniref:Uncharacterized protein n=1 Tax=Alkalibacterium iburiense TaxID=290589 RepID=A0ABN0XQE4_9LACT
MIAFDSFFHILLSPDVICICNRYYFLNYIIQIVMKQMGIGEIYPISWDFFSLLEQCNQKRMTNEDNANIVAAFLEFMIPTCQYIIYNRK